MVKYCPKCGTVNDDNADKCSVCGHEFSPDLLDEVNVESRNKFESQARGAIPVESSLSLIPTMYDE
ncbi:zinc ribbon domain-containing protein [Acidianus sp. HS-5]|uniref:zinc ribbon domain-containing protein n=1 Tax=Acidianus sp. HS-5 TaxID=2886040 RepID=UPI001F3A8EA4|nr:zinc ribbon domain-containing protein [Acidianus sp. HS-5]BDC17801.1 hypothetical protein HS5_06910 [Acidianus sp. HS-5]